MWYPTPDITPREFEDWVGAVFEAASPGLEDLRVTIHDRISGTDGSFTFDATVRYRWAGLEFLVVVEAKLHTNPIKRELVQVLLSKVQSVGAHKGVMISTAPFQQGAIEFATVHGIALVAVTEGRFTFETRTKEPGPALSREEASAMYGTPTFVGHYYEVGDDPGSISRTMISTESPEYVQKLLLGIPESASQ